VYQALIERSGNNTTLSKHRFWQVSPNEKISPSGYERRLFAVPRSLLTNQSEVSEKLTFFANFAPPTNYPTFLIQAT